MNTEGKIHSTKKGSIPSPEMSKVTITSKFDYHLDCFNKIEMLALSDLNPSEIQIFPCSKTTNY